MVCGRNARTVAAFEQPFRSRDWELLGRAAHQLTAHQLKGAAGSYGFDQLTSYAGRLEAAVSDQIAKPEILESL